MQPVQNWSLLTNVSWFKKRMPKGVVAVAVEAHSSWLRWGYGACSGAKPSRIEQRLRTSSEEKQSFAEQASSWGSYHLRSQNIGAWCTPDCPASVQLCLVWMAASTDVGCMHRHHQSCFFLTRRKKITTTSSSIIAWTPSVARKCSCKKKIIPNNDE